MLSGDYVLAQHQETPRRTQDVLGSASPSSLRVKSVQFRSPTPSLARSQQLPRRRARGVLRYMYMYSTSTACESSRDLEQEAVPAEAAPLDPEDPPEQS